MAPGRTSILVAVTLAAGLGPACHTALTLRDLDGLARETQARTVLLLPELSLYSPYDLEATREFAGVIEREREAIYRLFGVSPAVPALVWLWPNDELGIDILTEDGEVTIQDVVITPENRILGSASEDAIRIQVAPVAYHDTGDGSSFPRYFAAQTYVETIRHELAHVATSALGIRGRDWLDEGLAHAVEWTAVDGDRLVIDETPRELKWAALVPHDERSLRTLLDWRQDLESPGKADERARLLSLSLVVFLLEETGDGTFRDAVLRIAALSDDALLAREAAWQEWLDLIRG